MELWDILNRDGSLTGRTIERGKPLKDGEYHLVVHIWIRNSKGEYLIQKRSDKLELWPGMWAVTGGSAIIGEDSLTAALREAMEELGIILKPEALEKRVRVIRKNALSDLWLTCMDVNLKDIKLQREEVSDARFARMEEILEMIDRGEFLDYGQDYLSYLL